MLENAEKYELLYSTQDKILKIVADLNLGFYLTGGTALQRFHFSEYRYSDDLDLFLLENGVKMANAKEFDLFLKALSDFNIEFSVRVENPYFKQIILKENDLKIDLVNDYVFHENDFIKTSQGFYIDSIENIFTNKLETSFSRDEPRDLLDIYTILKNTKIDFEKIFVLLNKKTNLSPQEIVENLKAVDINSIDLAKISFKNNEVLKDFVENFSEVVLKCFKNIDKETKIQAAQEKSKDFTKSKTHTKKDIER